jgi:tetratricopeptide (TPR) repeat protein
MDKNQVKINLVKEDSVAESKKVDPKKFGSSSSVGVKKGRTNLVDPLDKVTKICIHLAVFLIPLFFLPATASPIEFNKLMLLIILVGVAGTAWLGRMVSENKLQIKRSFLSIPILIFAAIYSLASIFSVYRENSVWGYLGGEGTSLMAVLFFVLLFFVVTNNFNKKDSVYFLVFNFLISSSLVFLSALLHLLGINLFGFLKGVGNSFNTIGTIFSLSIYAGSLLILSLSLLTERVGGKLLRIVAAITTILALMIIVLIDFKLIWIILAILLGLSMVVGILRNNKGKPSLFWLPTLVFIFCLFGIFAKNPFFNVPNLPVEVSPSWGNTLQVIIGGLKEKFFFGAGPGNFSYFYGEYKMPLGNLATIDFNQGVSFVSTLFATGGILLGLSFLFLVFVMGRYVLINVYDSFFKEEKEDRGEEGKTRLVTPLSLLWLFITIMLFLTTSSLTLLFVWWLTFAAIGALSNRDKFFEEKKTRASSSAEKIGMKGQTDLKPKPSKVSLAISLLFVGILTSFIAVVYVLGQKYIASCYYRKALAQASTADPDLEKVGQDLSQSVYYNQNRDLSFLALSDTLLLLAQDRIREKGADLNDEDRSFIWEAISGGMQAANSAITVNKSGYKNYLKLALVYQNIIGLVEGAEKPAIENYEKARDLNPNNFYIYDQLAGVYFSLYDLEIMNKAEENEGQLSEVPDSAKEYLTKAEEQIDKSLAIYPLNPTAKEMLISVRELQGDLDGAIQIAEEKLNFSREDFRSALVLGLLYYKNKDYKKTIDLLESVTKRWDSFSDARYILGLSYSQKGELEKAKEQFEKIQEFNPDNKDVKDILGDLAKGRTDFLAKRGEQKVEEVQQGIEEEQRQESQREQTILNNEGEKVPGSEAETGEENLPIEEENIPEE